MKRRLIYLLIALQCIACTNKSDIINLSGTWNIKLDSTDVGITEGWQNEQFAQTITLPGTTDEAGIGVESTLEVEMVRPQLDHLTRKNSFIGAAWYSKEIEVPSNFEGKDIILSIERVLWETQVWIDNTKVEGFQESLTTPHKYDLTQYLTSGKSHKLTIRVDNRKKHDISNDMAHSYTDHTQIKWNGMIGELKIEAFDKIRVADVKLYPDIDNKNVKAIVTILNGSDKSSLVALDMIVNQKDGVQKFKNTTKEVTANSGETTVELTYDMGSDFIAWSEFTPTIYQAKVSATTDQTSSSVTEDFGMRKIKAVGNKMYINDRPLFLRGTLECCIFPLTGRPPMDHAGWEKVFTAAKDYGLNHLRFHSWCPPKAAFEVADKMGFYLQVELPVWVLTIGEDQGAIDFMYAEGDNIINNYGNHPSFCLWSMGNELEGDMSIPMEMTNHLKAKDSRHLYTMSSFTLEKGYGVWPESCDDFFITQWTKHGWVRGQGVFNQFAPHFDKNYNEQLVGADIPLITHEIGQYSVYPDIKEIEKYTGVLKPLNFMAIKEDLEKKGLIDKADDYLKASGSLAALLYKEEIERALKTAGISGFQLLDLHDFPGQGTALVGVLNAFWESKGAISGKEFREFCSPVVPLIRFAKATYKNNEKFSAEIELCNYSEGKLKDRVIIWQVKDGDKVIATDSCSVKVANFGYNGDLGDINIDLSGVTKASKLDVIVKVNDSDYINRWNIWVYPARKEIKWGDVKYTTNFNEAKTLLSRGEKVLFNPDWREIKGIEGKFVPVFWSPIHFPKQAGTMGILCDPNHKALSDFPTDMHTDWQWWDLNINSTTMIVDSIKGGEAIVEMIDNFTNNRRLASLYEGKVGKGKLMLASFDLKSDLESRMVANQMLSSILDYMNSSDFEPATIENFDVIKTLLGGDNDKKGSAKDIY